MKNFNSDKWLKSGPTSFCAGCQYGIILNYLAAALDNLALEPKNIAAISGIGCAGWITDRYLRVDTIHTTHGRALPLATGIKLAEPDLTVIVSSGDGDLSTIGGNHLIHSARRNLNITVICANNSLYGMTGGQASSTTPKGAVTSTTPAGNQDKPLDLVELVLACGCSFAARYPALFKYPRRVVKAIAGAIEHPGFSLIELMAPCVTHFNRKNKISSPDDLLEYLASQVISRKKAGLTAADKKQNKLISGTFTSIFEYASLKE